MIAGWLKRRVRGVKSVGGWCVKIKVVGFLVIFLVGGAGAKERFNNDESVTRNVMCDISRADNSPNRKAQLTAETVVNVRQISKGKVESMKRSTTSVKEKMEFGQRSLAPCDLCRTSPIALDIDGSGKVERIEGDFNFDFIGEGRKNNVVEWFAPTEGILFDTRVPGPMTGKQLFGDMGGKYSDGFAKLAILDKNRDGQLKEQELKGLAIWTDKNSNTQVEQDEISMLAAHGIISIKVKHQDYVSSGMKIDGGKIRVEDLWFALELMP
jgi:hypothetical protein